MKCKLTKGQKEYIEDCLQSDYDLGKVFGYCYYMRIVDFKKKIKKICKEYCFNREATRYAIYLGDKRIKEDRL